MPWMNRVGRSIATAPTAATLPALPPPNRLLLPATKMVRTNAPARLPSVMARCSVRRSGRGENASTSTPTMAAPKTSSIGESCPYWMCGAGMVGAIAARDPVTACSRSCARLRHQLDRAGRRVRRDRVGRVRLDQRLVDGRVDHVDDRLRVHAEHDDQRDQRADRPQLARPQVGHGGDVLADRAGHRALVHPQDVDRGQDDPDGGQRGGHLVPGEGADQHEELADEGGQAGHGQPGQAGDEEQAGQDRERPSARRRSRRSAASAGGRS